MTTLQTAWNETWRGEKFDTFFGDVLNERISAVKLEMNKKIDDLYRQNIEAKREKEEAKREKEFERIQKEAILKRSVLKLHEKGLSIDDISESLEIPEKTVKVILKK